MKLTNVGIIGLGVIGKRMARNKEWQEIWEFIQNSMSLVDMMSV